MPRREQGAAIVQVEAAERIHPASFRDVEVKLTGRAIERGAREEPPGQMGLPSREEVEPLTYLDGDALVVNLGIGVAALPEGGRARGQIRLGLLRPPRAPRADSHPRLSAAALRRRAVALIHSDHGVPVASIQTGLPCPEPLPSPRR